MKYLTVAEALDLATLACGAQPVVVRDLGLLSSASHRPASEMYGVPAYPDLFEKAGALLQSLAGNHPLVDGNKRLAWLCTAVFLDLNGVSLLDVDQERAYDLVMEVAAGKIEDVGVVGHALRELSGAG
ncbi:type II toxin-antitoxin system death-on-curing family toxin [Streptomyces sp. DSM 44915]|uniref:Type II toxin-antitoxin system death-on-curing family toxin n=1 Tax=Streptomyces chisholmiae TaxID=3075540 RepID=A0ABU2JSB6_9ACTN|nr:type II toxin-antitoxin system death-on-curing family toxin [Streptomyces sp. DSM 44915]MDT0267867.1 type II toxin-antitoxin system death-on-curing family toxin [Streptomyces sp. DSM 44915]